MVELALDCCPLVFIAVLFPLNKHVFDDMIHIQFHHGTCTQVEGRFNIIHLKETSKETSEIDLIRDLT